MCCCYDSWPSLVPWPLPMGQEGLFVPIPCLHPPQPPSSFFSSAPSLLPGCCIASPGAKGQLVASCSTSGLGVPLPRGPLDLKGNQLKGTGPAPGPTCFWPSPGH